MQYGKSCHIAAGLELGAAGERNCHVFARRNPQMRCPESGQAPLANRLVQVGVWVLTAVQNRLIISASCKAATRWGFWLSSTASFHETDKGEF